MSDSVAGRWQGIYGYAGGLAAHRFEAELSDHDGALAGVIEEPGDDGPGPMSATLTGTRAGQSVDFVKHYDAHEWPLDPIAYAGTLSEDGLEIAGGWTISAGGHGSFVMRRAGGVEEERVLEVEAPVEPSFEV